MKMTNLHKLIAILNDKSDLWNRYDAALEISEYDNQEALEALIALASDPNEDVVFISRCGEAISTIWHRLKIFDEKIYRQLQPSAQREIDHEKLQKNCTLFSDTC